MISQDVARRVASSEVLLDWLPVLLAAPILIIDAAISAVGKPLTVVSVLSAFVACLPLGLRRHVSFPLLSPLIVAGVILVLWQLHPANTVVIIPMVVLFHLALSGDRRRSLWMGLAIVPCVVISVIPFASGFSHITSIVVRNVALCLLAIAAGDLLRTRRVSEQRMVEAAEQRTLRQVGEERLLIAREIHDLVAHAMTAINVQAGVAAHLLERDPHQAYHALRDIKQTSGDALTELRSTLEVLRDPSQAAPLGPVASLADIDELTSGLRTAGNRGRHRRERRGRRPGRGPERRLPDRAGGADQRRPPCGGLQHPGVRAARIRGGHDRGHRRRSRLSCRATGRRPGNGLRGMRERATALGGTLEAAPGDAGGWRVWARLPVDPPGGEATSHSNGLGAKP